MLFKSVRKMRAVYAEAAVLTRATCCFVDGLGNYDCVQKVDIFA